MSSLVDVEEVATLKSRLWITQGHWK